jgi:predicted enzyme related to lactoylglutathione lyase
MTQNAQNTHGVRKVGIIILLEHNLASGIEFYKTLGMNMTFSLPDKWAEFEVGDVKIGLCPTEHEPFDRHTGIVFEVDNVQALYDAHKDTLSFVREPVEAVHGIMTSVKDPGGNIIDLYQPTPDRVKEMVEKMKNEETQQQEVKKEDVK